MRKLFAFALLTATMFLASTSAAAQNTPMSPDADGGGNEFTVSCPANHAVTRIFGAMGAWLNSVRVGCRQVTADGHWIGPEVLSATRAGGINEDNYNSACDPDHVVSGLIAWTLLGVNRFQVLCQKLTANAAVTGPTIPEPVVGITPGNSWGPTICSNSNPASGLIGMAGPLAVNGIQRLGYSCARPATFRLQSITGPYSMTAGNSATGYARFNRNVPAGTETVNLFTSNESLATIDGSATVSSGSDRDGFTIRAAGTGGCVTISGVNRGVTQTAKIVVHGGAEPMARFGFTVPDTYLFLGTSANGTITVPGGGNVSFSSSNTSVATVPASVDAPSSGSTTVAIRGAGQGCAVITATVGGRSVRRTVQVIPIPS